MRMESVDLSHELRVTCRVITLHSISQDRGIHVTVPISQDVLQHFSSSDPRVLPSNPRLERETDWEPGHSFVILTLLSTLVFVSTYIYNTH